MESLTTLLRIYNSANVDAELREIARVEIVRIMESVS